MTRLQLGQQEVKIEAGELISYQVDGHEFVHQKESPGWRNADTEMFPIIGPTNEADFRVHTLKGKAIQDQHGFLREMLYELVHHKETKAIFRKKYVANTLVKNSKFPDKSTEEKLSWPYNFEFVKSFKLNESGLQIQFKISGEKGMPFMLGYHPAFKLTSENTFILENNKKIPIKEVIAVGNRAMEIKDCDTITLEDEKSLEITSEGFGSFMLWTEVTNMVCIEPITFYPYVVAQEDLYEGFQKLTDDNSIFKVLIRPK